VSQTHPNTNSSIIQVYFKPHTHSINKYISGSLTSIHTDPNPFHNDRYTPQRQPAAVCKLPVRSSMLPSQTRPQMDAITLLHHPQYTSTQLLYPRKNTTLVLIHSAPAWPTHHPSQPKLVTQNPLPFSAAQNKTKNKKNARYPTNPHERSSQNR